MTKKSEQIYNDLLHQFKINGENVSSEFNKKLSLKLLEISSLKKKKKVFNFKTKTLLAAAAAFIFVLSFTLVSILKTNSADRELIYESTVKQGMPVTINLNYNSTEDFDNVKFSLKLEEGVSFYSENPEIRKKNNHTWNGKLSKGINEIPFIVKTSKLGKMKILARAEIPGFVHQQEIILNAKEAEITVSMYSVNLVSNK